jgi:hypothetical protein
MILKSPCSPKARMKLALKRSRISDIEMKIENLKLKMKELRKKEINRLSKIYIQHQFEITFGAPYKTVMHALIGEMQTSKEIERLNHAKQVNYAFFISE